MSRTVEPPAISLRPANAADAQALFVWRNDPETRRQSLSGDIIPWEIHRAWLDGRLADPQCRLLIAECGGCPIGSVRCEIERSEEPAPRGLLSWQIAPDQRGQGYASLMLIAALAHPALAGLDLWAEIKPANIPSCRAALAAGLARVEETATLTRWRRRI